MAWVSAASFPSHHPAVLCGRSCIKSVTDPTANSKASHKEAAVEVKEGSSVIVLKRAATSVLNAESPLVTVSLHLDSKSFLLRVVRVETAFDGSLST